MAIDLSFLSEVVSELNYFFTNLARSEQMKDVDMRSKTSKMAKETDEDISSTTVNCSFEDDSVTLQVHTNDNNTKSVWMRNFYIMAKSLLPSKMLELVSFYSDKITDQLIPYAYSEIGGALA